MPEIICPNCGKAFKIDETSYADILKQVRDREFRAEVQDKTDSAVRLAEAEKEKIIAQLQQKLAAAEEQKATAVRLAEAEKDKVIADLRAKETIAVQTAKQAGESERHKLELEKAELRSAWETAQKELQAQSAAHKLALQDKDAEIERVRDMKARLSTKMVGETLEQHCEIQFNQIRMAAFPRAYFEKDNDASGGTKGDYIFRDYAEDGTEYISIMFEMKNEMDTTATKHRNEDFFKKLDKDRTEKGCEYAVLVSMLEADSELYNTGIVDVSYLYPKMYVIRPQFFLPIISLLRNAAQGSLQYRQQLEIAKHQNEDVENFTRQLNEFKQKFSKNYQDATNRYNDAIKEIDATISHLQKVKESLLTSGEHLRRANSKVEDLTIKRLTRGNPTMTEKFAAAGIDTE
ncbi:MAG: DUF2130 domain-containing protein [Ruminococcus sp.]|nr:DUF2130 domain-containing protein [Ruminococcus sp.]